MLGSTLVSRQLLQSPLLRSSCSLHVGAIQIACRRLASSSRPQSTWAMTNNSNRRQQGKVLPALRQRRPLVNGEAVAFHINDLVNHNTYQNRFVQPLAKNYDSDLIVVLDMDECLIHSQFLSANGAQYAHQLQSRQQNHHQHMGMVDTFRISLPDGDLVQVHVRPHLDDFLERVTAKYETHIFTAAMEIYAKPVLDKLDPDGTRFAGRWYREHCHFDPVQGAYIKKLDKLPPLIENNLLDRVVLVDNNPLSFLSNPSNGILVSSFYTDPTDTTLPAVEKLLEELDGHDDVRPLLEERFGMREALQEIQAANKAA